MPSGAALITDVLVRRIRLNELTTAATRKVVDGGRRIFFPLRTQLYCKYDLLSCATVYTLTGLKQRFREYFVRALDAALKQARSAEEQSRQSLSAARDRLTGLQQAIRTEQDAIIAARSHESTLTDQSAALHVLVANQEKDLRNRAAIELQRTQEEIATRLEQKFLVWQGEIDEHTRQRDAMISQATEQAQSACRLLSRLTRATSGQPSGETATAITARGTLSCRQWALSNYAWLREAERLCASSGALILTTENVNEIDAIVQTCEPLRTLRIQHLAETRQNLQAEQERNERLLRVARTARIGVKDYADNMYDYLRWLHCFQKTVADPTWNVACSDSETLRTYRSTAATANTNVDGIEQLARTETSFMLASLDTNHVEYMRKMVFIAVPSHGGMSVVRKSQSHRERHVESPLRSSRTSLTSIKSAARTACVLHSLTSDLREDACPRPKEVIFRELLARGGEPGGVRDDNLSDDEVVKIVTQRVFRLPIGIKEPEKRGLAFAMLLAACPIDILEK